MCVKKYNMCLQAACEAQLAAQLYTCSLFLIPLVAALYRHHPGVTPTLSTYCSLVVVR